MPRDNPVPGHFGCPHCGADVPARAVACPECGSDKETGWNEDAIYAELLPDDDEQISTPQSSGPWNGAFMAIAAPLAACALLLFTVPGGIYLVPGVMLAALLWYFRAKLPWPKAAAVEKDLYRRLLQKSRGDRELVGRILAQERLRAPKADRAQLLQNAIFRWERDNR